MNVLVFGKSGQVAQALQPYDNVLCLGRNQADLTSCDIETIIKDHAPDAVINAAAYTAVDKAETEEATAQALNGTAPGVMARTCAALDIPFVHISTDYVFAGDGETPHHPDAPIAPQNAYGRSKRLGEEAVLEAGGRFVILRTSWVFSATGANFLKTMLRLGRDRDELSIVADQIGGPTPATKIAEACMQIATALRTEPRKSGVYHFAGTPAVSWADFARAIFDAAGLRVAVHDIPSAQYPTPAARPLNSRLDCSTVTDQFGIECPRWDSSVSQIVNQLKDETS